MIIRSVQVDRQPDRGFIKLTNNKPDEIVLFCFVVLWNFLAI